MAVSGSTGAGVSEDTRPLFASPGQPPVMELLRCKSAAHVGKRPVLFELPRTWLFELVELSSRDARSGHHPIKLCGCGQWWEVRITNVQVTRRAA